MYKTLSFICTSNILALLIVLHTNIDHRCCQCRDVKMLEFQHSESVFRYSVVVVKKQEKKATADKVAVCLQNFKALKIITYIVKL